MCVCVCVCVPVCVHVSPRFRLSLNQTYPASGARHENNVFDTCVGDTGHQDVRDTAELDNGQLCSCDEESAPVTSFGHKEHLRELSTHKRHARNKTALEEERLWSSDMCSLLSQR